MLETSPSTTEVEMWKWFVCLFRGHQWNTWFEKQWRRNRTVCQRCCAEKTALFDTDLNPFLF